MIVWHSNAALVNVMVTVKVRQTIPLLEIIGTDKNYRGCHITLLPGLSRLTGQGARLERSLRICLGKKSDVRCDKTYLMVQDCDQPDDETKTH